MTMKNQDTTVNDTTGETEMIRNRQIEGTNDNSLSDICMQSVDSLQTSITETSTMEDAVGSTRSPPNTSSYGTSTVENGQETAIQVPEMDNFSIEEDIGTLFEHIETPKNLVQVKKKKQKNDSRRHEQRDELSPQPVSKPMKEENSCCRQVVTPTPQKSNSIIATHSTPAMNKTKSITPPPPPSLLASLGLPGNSTLKVVTFDRPPSTFASKIHKMISEMDSTDPSAMRWVENGEAFTIDENHPELEKTLTTYFQTSKMSSLRRQLNAYGWSKGRAGSERFAGAWYHPIFNRNYNHVAGSPLKKHNPQSGLDTTTPPPSTRAAIASSSQKKTTKSQKIGGRIIVEDPNKMAITVPKKPVKVKSWGRKNFLVVKEPRTTHSGSTRRNSTAEGSWALTVNKRCPFDASSYTELQQTPTKSNVAHYNYDPMAFSISPNDITMGPDVQEDVYSTPHKQLMLQPLFSPPINGCGAVLSPTHAGGGVHGNHGQTHNSKQLHDWNPNYLGSDAMDLSTRGLNFEPKAVRVEFYLGDDHPASCFLSPLRAPPMTPKDDHLVSAEGLSMVPVQEEQEESSFFESENILHSPQNSSGDSSRPTTHCPGNKIYGFHNLGMFEV